MKKALITWITWQDGSYLAELLLKKGYEVHGLRRRSSSFNTERIDHLRQIQQDHDKAKLFLHFGDMTDSANLIRLVNEIKPDEIYNLAAQSHVHISFDIPEYTANWDWVGTLRLLEAIRIAWIEKTCRFYQASTSEMFGGVGHNMPSTGYTEESHFYPRSPYGAAKLYAHWITKNYYESYGIYACCGILFNHESPRRWENFVTRKITMAVAKINFWLQEKLFIGNMYAKRDPGQPGFQRGKKKGLRLTSGFPSFVRLPPGTRWSRLKVSCRDRPYILSSCRSRIIVMRCIKSKKRTIVVPSLWC